MPDVYIMFLLGVLQVVILGIGSWSLLTIIKVNQKQGILETKFEEGLMRRVDRLEKQEASVGERLTKIEAGIADVKQIHLACPARIAHDNHDKKR